MLLRVADRGMQPAINRNVPEQPVALPCEALLRRVLSRQMQLRRIAKRRIYHVINVSELMPQETGEFLRSVESLNAQCYHNGSPVLCADVEFCAFVVFDAGFPE